MKIETDVSDTQFANFLEVANNMGVSAKALLRQLVVITGLEAEPIRKGKGKIRAVTYKE